MIRVLPMTFLLPKLGVLYLFEIWLMALALVFSSKVALRGGVLKLDTLAYSHRALIAVSAILFLWSTLILLAAAMLSGENHINDLLRAGKFGLYFIVCLLAINRKFSANFYKNYDLVIYVFFGISLILYLIFDVQSTSQRLWMTDNLGARFVGFTGASIGFSGLTLLGSTANSVGMLYFLSFAFFWHHSKKILPMVVCALGCLLTLSQVAALALAVFVALSLIRNFRDLRYWFFTLAAMGVIVGMSFTLDYDVFSRLNSTVTGIASGSLQTAGDRLSQLQILSVRMSECPSLIFLGAALADSYSCGQSAIVESFFLYQLSLFGVIGLLLSVCHFFLFSDSLRKYLFGGSVTALGLWFGTNLFIANTYQTDFVMMSLLLLLAGRFYTEHSKL